jgi:2-dehydropantoate 2-reductase
MRILVVGAGATGGYFGARLAQAGRDVTFLIRKNRIEQLRITGVQVLSPHGDFVAKPRLVTVEELSDTYDLVLIAVKAYSLRAAVEDFAPAVGPQTMILPVLNGMQHIETLAARFGEEAVIGGLCRINATVDYRGRVVQMNDLHELWYGERNAASSQRIEGLHQVLRNAGFEAFLSPTILAKLWEKWTLLATIGGITCLMRGDLGDVARASGGIEFSLSFLDEVVSVATAAGFPPEEGFLTTTKGWLTKKDSTQTTSMYRDLVKGRPIEADQILGDLLIQARRHRVSVPLVAAAYSNLSVYQNRTDSPGP